MRGSSTNIRHFVAVTILILVTTVIVNWLMKTALPLPIQGSTQALIVDNIFDLNILFISFFFSLVMVIVLYAVFAFRKREDEDDEAEGEHFEGNSILEIVWTVVPLIIVIGLGVVGVTTITEVTAAKENEMVVNVEGFQWGWTFAYPDEGGFITTEMVLPVDVPARMDMTSKDVNHSFWIPETRVKQDLVRGQITELRFTPKEVGAYKLRCAELCGLSHWKMLADVRVVEQDEYDAWLAENSQ